MDPELAMRLVKESYGADVLLVDVLDKFPAIFASLHLVYRHFGRSHQRPQCCIRERQRGDFVSFVTVREVSRSPIVVTGKVRDGKCPKDSECC